MDFDQLIRTTAENMTRNLRKNLRHLMCGINDDKLWNEIDDFLQGSEIPEYVMEKSDGNNLELIKIKMMITEIDNVRQRVEKVLRELRNISDHDVKKVLETLKMRELITEDQFRKMVIAENDILKFAKAITGSGLWISRQ